MSGQDPLERKPPASNQIPFLILVLAAITLPHLNNLNTTLMGFFVTASAWRFTAIRWQRLLPGKGLLAVLTLAAIALVMTGIPLRDGRLVGTALLVVMLGLKLLELRTRRDIHIGIFLGFFMVLTQFLYNQNLWLAIYLFTLTGLLLTLLIDVNSHHLGQVGAARQAGKQLLVALPLALLLFFLFPRLDAPLWAINVHGNNAVTGVSDRVRFGEIGRLSQSDAPAFRVRFLNREPPQQQLYWRGLVLWDFDGETWSPGHSDRLSSRIEFDPDSRVDYEITMEPSGQYWLFPLDIPTAVPGELQVGPDLETRAKERLNERAIYRFSSHTRYRLQDIGARQRQQGLQLPARIGSRTEELALKWRVRHPDDDTAVVDEALRFFNQQPFVYTLSPGTGSGDAVESFLFERRRGFCEHYAGSFTLLMRLAGIPARVIVGYQGGERNPLSGHFTIHQYDAHAWSEVWLKDKGWTRIDPTAAVAPERVEQSIDIAQSSNQGRIAFNIGDSGWLRQLARNARWARDAAELRWHRWILGYSPTRQQSLMQALGLSRLGGYAAAVILGLLLISGLLIFYLLVRHTPRRATDPLFHDWQALQHKLRKAGLNIPPWLGPEQLLSRASARWPNHADSLTDITRRYVRLRYGTVQGAAHRKRLHQRIRRLKIRKMAVRKGSGKETDLPVH